MSSQNDHGGYSTGGNAAREGQPSRDRPDQDRPDQDRPDQEHGGDQAGRAGGGDRLHRVGGDRADRGARWNRGDRPYVDAQILTDVGAQVYEAVATLEYGGHAVTRDEVMAATDLDDATVSEILDALTGQGVLIRDGDVFELARRDWSATPETPSR